MFCVLIFLRLPAHFRGMTDKLAGAKPSSPAGVGPILLEAKNVPRGNSRCNASLVHFIHTAREKVARGEERHADRL